MAILVPLFTCPDRSMSLAKFIQCLLLPEMTRRVVLGSGKQPLLFGAVREASRKIRLCLAFFILGLT